jgi:hypothetical protein
MSTQLTLSSPRCRLSSGRRHHAVSHFILMESRRARSLRFIFRQCFIPSPPLSCWNQSVESAPQPSASSPDSPTITLHCYKKVISILPTLPITQPHLHFASSLARASHHRSSTRRHRSLSLSSHAHHLSAQRHPRWWTSRPSFASWTAYQHVNSCN